MMIQLFFTISSWLLFRATTLWETDRGTDQGLTVKGYQADAWGTMPPHHLRPFIQYKTTLQNWNDQQVIVENNIKCMTWACEKGTLQNQMQTVIIAAVI